MAAAVANAGPANVLYSDQWYTESWYTEPQTNASLITPLHEFNILIHYLKHTIGENVDQRRISKAGVFLPAQSQL
jgi:hypothetical protein